MAAPETTLVPMNRMLSRSSGLLVSLSCWRGNFSTGIDSPVMAAWLTNRSLALSTRQSAGIMSPAESTIRSPGTSCLIGSSMRCAPWRMTVAVLLTIAFSASAAWLDLASCQNRSKVERTTMEKITGGFHVLGQPGDKRQQGQQQVERVFVAVPQVNPPRQRLLVLDL